jgi:cytoskeletal protein CcmA (bactofilin family)
VSCLSDPVYALYVAGELEREEGRRVEAHLVQCRRCRALVLALRDDPELRSEVLHGRPAPAAAPGPQPGAPPGHAHALALSLTLLGLAAVAAAGAALFESGLARASGGQGPLHWSWRGAYAMAIDLVFVLRESAPALFDLALPVAAMASASALLSFALSALRRRIGGPGAKALAALALLAAPVESRAHFGLHEHEDVQVDAGSVHEGALVASARSVSVDGVVDGDLVVLTERLTVRGEVRGNVFAVAQEIDLRGVVQGSVFSGGERARIGGDVRGDVYAAGESVALEPDGRVGRDANVVAEQLLLEGRVARDANALFAGRVELRGPVGRHLRARAESVALLENARVGGGVEATLPEGARIERHAAAQVAGEVRTAHRERRRSLLDRYRSPELYAWMLLHVGAGFVLGMLLHRIAPGILAVRAEGPRDLLRAAGVGLVTLVAAPIALLLAAATLVGLPVALIGAGTLLAALYVALVAVAALVGGALVRPGPDGRAGFGAALAAGLAILVALTHLPLLGDPLRVVAVLTGLGLLVERARSAWRARRAPVAT